MALVKLELEMSEEEWAELAYALETKAKRVADGEYGPEHIPGANKAWAACLDGIYVKVTSVLTSKNVPW